VQQLEHSVSVPPSLTGGDLWVVFTGWAHTSKVLSMVAGLAARISIVAAHVVPYPLPLLDPAVNPTFLEHRLLRLALSTAVDTTSQIYLRVYLCRDQVETLDRVLPAGAKVVIGGRRHWWRTAEQRLARSLARDGRTIFFFDPKQP